MELAVAAGLLEAAFVPSLQPDADTGALVAGVYAITRLRAGLDALEASYVSRLAVSSSFPERDIAAATRTGTSTAGRLLKRVDLLERVPAFAEAFERGDITSGHLDVLGWILRGLEAGQRSQFLANPELVAIATTATVAEFTQTLRTEAARVRAGDGTEDVVPGSVEVRW
jgi:hypothetical protein